MLQLQTSLRGTGWESFKLCATIAAPDRDNFMKRIQIKFVQLPKLQLLIRYVMKNPRPILPDAAAPSIFQAAAQPECVIPLSDKMPFADLMLHPAKVEAVLKAVDDGHKSSGKPIARKSAIGGQRTKTSGRAVKIKTHNPKGIL